MSGNMPERDSSTPTGAVQQPEKLTCQDAAAPGFVFGVFLGQSASPVLGVCITGLFALLAAMFKPDALKNAPSITREFIVAVSLWLGVGATVGVIIRANDLLHWEPGLRRKYELMGFKRDQIDRIMDHEARVAAGEYRSLRADASDLGFDDNEMKVLMDRMTRTLVLPIGRPTLPTPLSSLTDAKKQPGASAQKPGTDSSLWSGTGAATFGQILNDIKEVEDSSANPKYKQVEAELRILRGLVTDLNEKLTRNPTVDAETVRVLELFQQYFDSMLDASNGATLKERRLSASTTERTLVEILNQPTQK